MHLTDTLAGNRDVFPLPALKNPSSPPPPLIDEYDNLT